MNCWVRRPHILIGVLCLLSVGLWTVIPPVWAGYDGLHTYEDQSGHADRLHAAGYDDLGNYMGLYPMGYAGFVPGVTVPMTGNHPGVLVPDPDNPYNIYGHVNADGLNEDAVNYGWSVVRNPLIVGSDFSSQITGSWENWVANHIIFGPPGHGSYPVLFPETNGGQHVGPGYENQCDINTYCWQTAAPPYILYAPDGTSLRASGIGSDPQTGYDFIDPANDSLAGPYSDFEYSDIDSAGYEPSADDDPANPGLNTTLEPYERIHTQNFLIQDDVKFIDDTFTYVPWGEGVGLPLHLIIPDASKMPILPDAFPGTQLDSYYRTAEGDINVGPDPLAYFDRTYFVDILRAWDHTQDTNLTPDGQTDEKFELYETREIDFKFFTSSHSLEQNWGMFDLTVHDEGLANHIITADPGDPRTDGNGDPLYWYADYVHYAVKQHHEQKMHDWGTFDSGKEFEVISAMKYAIDHDKSPIYTEIDPDNRIVDYYTPIALVHNEWGGHGNLTSSLYSPDVLSHDP